MIGVVWCGLEGCGEVWRGVEGYEGVWRSVKGCGVVLVVWSGGICVV